MQTYEVVIKATVTKTITVEADTEDAAENLAHELFSAEYVSGSNEGYEEDTISVVEV